MTDIVWRRTDESKKLMFANIETYENRWNEWTERATDFCVRDPMKALILLAQNLRNYPLINLRQLPVADLRSYPLLGGQGNPAAPVDPLFASVVLLLGFNGVDGSSLSTDESNTGHILTFVSGAQLDTAKKKFGLSSLLLDGVTPGDFITIPDHAEHTITQSMAFTHEAWAYRPTAGTLTNGVIVGNYHSTGNERSWRLWVDAAGDKLNWIGHNGGGAASPSWTVISSAAITLDTWEHLAGERDTNMDVRVFINGVSAATVVNTSVIAHNSDKVLRVGALESSGALIHLWNGWLDEIRMTHNDFRYGGNFIPATDRWPRE